MPAADRLIVPLDVPTLDAAMGWVERLPDVTFWKVGLELFVGAGPRVLTELRQRQKQIFLDLKLHDIPNTVAGACRAVDAVELMTVHAAGGMQMLQAAVAAFGDRGDRPRLLAVSVLTSLDARALAFELRVPLELPDYALQMALLARDAGIDGAVCSPREVAQLREVCGKDFLLVCPGVRPRGSNIGDQRRVMTPAEAIRAGADYLVIGRPIVAAPDPVAAWQQVCAEVDAAL
ncbi:orotidine-5'-phosphate decarboxylase [Rubidibacter lacunae]|uniref:orotidine-5'-phosphate decarboxylase n=1 Tax=Rubidibacter lacunae TaxID=582514 RepID=UPI0012EBDE0C|nr:orotidine-5'-phosphate decarboxylase [Rubidibacter lacunae]